MCFRFRISAEMFLYHLSMDVGVHRKTIQFLSFSLLLFDLFLIFQNEKPQLKWKKKKKKKAWKKTKVKKKHVVYVNRHPKAHWCQCWCIEHIVGFYDFNDRRLCTAYTAYIGLLFMYLAIGRSIRFRSFHRVHRNKLKHLMFYGGWRLPQCIEVCSIAMIIDWVLLLSLRLTECFCF